MKAEELVDNEYYVVNYGTEYLFINKPEERYGNQCYLSDRNTFCKGSSCLNGIYNGNFKNGEYRLATQEERNHLDACIKADKYVEAPKPEIINNYEIF